MNLRPLLALVTVALLPGVVHGADPSEYTIRWSKSTPLADVPAAHLARNAAQGFDAWIAPEGLRVRAPDGGWEVSLTLLRVGRDGALEAVKPAGVEPRGSEAKLHRGSLTEWYLNDERGLEQGFTLSEAPASEAGGPLVLELALGGDLLPLLAGDGRRVDLLRPGSPLPLLVYGSLAVVDAEGRTLPARMELGDGSEAGERRLRIVVEDANATYPVTVDPLVTTPAWTSAENDYSFSVAWGDWDGDGDLDLAVGNGNAPNRVYENTGGALASAWTSAESDNTVSVAWGDWDGDGDLDLAAANGGLSRVYENTGSGLAPGAVWNPGVPYNTQSVAWGDWNGDGDLDLAFGNYGPNFVFENTGGTLDPTPAWTSAESDWTRSVAWGDWNNDGDLDLAVAYTSRPNRVYQNTGGDLDPIGWFSADNDVTLSVAWGDWDGDGDLDLAAGNIIQPDRVYENTGSGLQAGAVWSSAASDRTREVAWGDWDGDGDLDLAAADDSQPNRLYENTGGALATAWTSVDTGNVENVAWGDWDDDGDLDLATGSHQLPNRLYENDGGALVEPAVWASGESDSTESVAWGDWNGDGDLDLAAVAVQVTPRHAVGTVELGGGPCENGVVKRPGRLPETPAAPVIPRRPGITAAAFFHSAEECLYSPVNIDYLLVDEEEDSARRIVPEYSLTGGGQWLPATEGPGSDGSQELSASAAGDPHLFVWDRLTDVAIRADNVVFRISVPHQASTRLAGPVQRAEMSAVSPPFRLCDPAADLQVTKTDGQATAVPGETVTYTVTVANVGTAPAPGARVTDTFPAALAGVTWTCDEGGGGTCANPSGSGSIDETLSLPMGTSVTFTATGTLDPAATGTLSNTATAEVAAGMVESDPSDNSDTDVDTLVPTTDLVITKTDGQTTTAPGEVVTYTLTVSSSGPSTVVGASVVDLFPAEISGVTWTCDESGGGTCANPAGSGSINETVDLPPGTSVTFTAAGTIDAAATELLSNTATATLAAGMTETDAADNSATDLDVLVPSTDLTVTKTDGQTEAVPGEAVTYVVTVSNAGPSDAVGAPVVDLFPAELTSVSWICDEAGGGTCANASGGGSINETVDLPVGTSVSFTAIAIVEPAARGALVNVATVLSGGRSVERLDEDPTDNTAVDVDTLTPVCDLAVTLDDGNDRAILGRDVTYTLVVANNGPSDVTAAAVTDTFPTALAGVAWTCDEAGGGTCANPAGSGSIAETVDLPVATSVTFTATGTVDPGATGTLDNTATIAGPAGTPDPVAANDSDTDSDTLLPEAIFADGFESGDTLQWSSSS